MLKSSIIFRFGRLKSFLTLGVITALPLASPAVGVELLSKPSGDADSITMVGGKNDATIICDDQDYPVVRLAASLFAEDVQRVTGHHPAVTNSPVGSTQLIVVGTLGKSALIQKLAADGKLKGLDQLQGRWETTLMQIVTAPFPGVDCALVIIGSDRGRGRGRGAPVVWDWRATTKFNPDGSGKIYLHIFQWPADGKFAVSSTYKAKLVKAYLSADPKTTVEGSAATEGDQTTFSLTLPTTAPDPIASVVCMEVAP